jgi:hypothetical protein
MPYDVTFLVRKWSDEHGVVVVTNYVLGRDPDGTVNGMIAKPHGSFSTRAEANRFVRRTWKVTRKNGTSPLNVLYHCEYEVSGFR